ncbi:MAG: bifunctional riboflavin kinase/FAD synthetase [Mogibacterium sp.]|nr:bifunctional riboflavin kinase/FAD synthetase [Mogibacterium sp.]
MEIYKSLDKLNLNEKTSVALGNFDGIHIGHREIFRAALDAAKDRDLKSLCFTFSNHPFNFILRRDDGDPDAVKLICTEEEKIALIEEMGFDILVNVPFDEKIMTMHAHDFFNGIVKEKLNAGYVSVGFNYTYGARAMGKPDILRVECEAAGIGVSIHDAVIVDGEVVSSTLIREMISTGNMEMTAKLLGRPYSFSGMVAHGKRLGSRMGIPTINIPAPARQMLPPNGVYFSRIQIDDHIYNSVSNIGVNPTVSDDGKQKVIETNIFDFDKDAYGKDIIVYFDHFSRGERKFRDKEELFAQIARDCENALNYRKK